MSSQASSLTSPTSIMKKVSSQIMLDMVKEFNTKKLINYLKRKDLKFDEDDIKIFHKEKVAGHDFLKLTEEKLKHYGIKGGSATRLVNFIKDLSQKLQNYSLLKTLDNLKKMLHKNKIAILTLFFTIIFEEINDNDKTFEHYMEDIILKLSNVKTMTDTNKMTCCKFISLILHASIIIAKKLTS
ncbi:hypothetical protein C1645_834865 [Glomus cerebriforme]|uniref:Uncharacterized protein n=1 Tax=Glomus cerebriforme TaxID=658196 RepID=A0A397SD09_9GLOM|nr:hypothetical protein C1645_834865 [Glomus cerebriforme]